MLRCFVIASLVAAFLISAPTCFAQTGWLADGKAEYRTPPISVELRVKLKAKTSYNILVASDTKQSGAHWELFSMPSTGVLTAYLPGAKPDHVRSNLNIADDAWHDIAMLYEPTRVRLYCDGKLVANQLIALTGKPIVPGPLAFARLVEGTLGCDGMIEYVRITRGLREPAVLHKAPIDADAQTVGLWRFAKSPAPTIDDYSMLKNPAKASSTTGSAKSATPPAGNQIFPSDPRFKAVLIDRSDNDAYLAVRCDSMGRVFVGGREAVFVFEPNKAGGYDKQTLMRFPRDSIIIGLEFLGNDLFVLTANALYRLPDGRSKRDGLKAERLLWGLPLDLHVSFHCMAWGPTGDLYLNHGDPLLNYGQWDRPDHFGHWTLFAGRDGRKILYTGAGSVIRVTPDGSTLRVVAGGLRGPVGLAFDRDWNLFTNDNDHESKADQYAPARLMHVTPGIDFGWPRGWMASKSPDRFDLVEPMIATLGRGVPCDMAYLDEPNVPKELRGQLLMCRWDRMAVTRYPLRAQGSTFQTEEHEFVKGQNLARPSGIAVGQGGRVWVTSLYLAGNVVSPYCVSDLVMLVPTDAKLPEPYEITTAPAERLWRDLSNDSWECRSRTHAEILRRGGTLLDEAARRLASVKADDPASRHLPWLAGAGGSAEAAALLVKRAKSDDPVVRRTALRVLAEHPKLKPEQTLFVEALQSNDLPTQQIALAYFQTAADPVPIALIADIAGSDDSYLRQTATRLLAARAMLKDVEALAKSPDARIRLAAALAIGTRLTVPPVHDVPPKELPLFYPAGNAFFHTKHRFVDAPGEVDLRDHGRVGSYTIAQRWKAIARTAEQDSLFTLLMQMLDDASIPVRSQSAYYLGLLRDDRAEPTIARVKRDLASQPLLGLKARAVDRAWALGPFADLSKMPRIEQSAIDLDGEYEAGSAKVGWRIVEQPKGVVGAESSYLHFRLQSARRQSALLDIDQGESVSVWHNGHLLDRSVKESSLVDLQPGSNDFLVRTPVKKIAIHYRAPAGVTLVLSEKLDASQLAQRLKEAGGTEKVAAEFLGVDWLAEAKSGDAVAGRKLFGTLGCVKCHAITADQKAGGGPSLTDARKRFTVPFLVESILLPSKQIAEPFRATTLTTKQGQLVSGLIVNESAESLELLLSDATRRTLAKRDIDELAASPVSPMPAGIVRTRRELSDLLAYLLSENPTPP